MFELKELLQENKNKHAGDVKRFLDSAKQRLGEVLPKYSIDSNVFYRNLEALAKRWYGGNTPIGDCDGTRLVNKVFNRELDNPMLIAVVADKLELFRAYYQDSVANRHTPMFWLELACIFGAQKIASHLGGIDQHIWAESDNIIPYSLSSGNDAFAIEVAQKVKVSHPSATGLQLIDLYNFCNRSTLETIKNMFRVALTAVN